MIINLDVGKLEVTDVLTELNRMNNEISALERYKEKYFNCQSKCVELQQEINDLKEKVIKNLTADNAELRSQVEQLKKQIIKLQDRETDREKIILELQDNKVTQDKTNVQLNEKIEELYRREEKRNALIKVGDLVRLAAFYYCKDWQFFCQEYRNLENKFEDKDATRDDFEKDRNKLISDCIGEELRSSIPALMILKDERNEISHTKNLGSEVQQRKFLKEFNVNLESCFPEYTTEINNTLKLLQKTPLKAQSKGHNIS